MPVWQWLLDSAGAVLLVIVLFGLLLVVRRRVLSRHGGTFELSVRDAGQPDGRGWVLGLGRYREDSLDWYRIFSPLPVPKRSWRRNDLTFLSQREPRGLRGVRPLRRARGRGVHDPTGEVELAMSPSSLTGLQSWLEAGPPGSRPSR